MTSMVLALRDPFCRDVEDSLCRTSLPHFVNREERWPAATAGSGRSPNSRCLKESVRFRALTRFRESRRFPTDCGRRRQRRNGALTIEVGGVWLFASLIAKGSWQSIWICQGRRRRNMRRRVQCAYDSELHQARPASRLSMMKEKQNEYDDRDWHAEKPEKDSATHDVRLHFCLRNGVTTAEGRSWFPRHGRRQKILRGPLKRTGSATIDSRSFGEMASRRTARQILDGTALYRSGSALCSAQHVFEARRHSPD